MTEHIVVLDVSARREDLEREIRGMAGHIVNSAKMREAHPTYGYTKSGIRRDWNFVRGLVAMYAFATGQTQNALGVHPFHVHFVMANTRTMLREAHQVVSSL